MFGFLLKKAFFDAWDNFLALFVINLLLFGVIGVSLAVTSLASYGSSVAATVVALGLVAAGLILWTAFAFGCANVISGFGAPRVRELLRRMKRLAGPLSIVALATLAALVVAGVAARFYGARWGFAGLVLSALVVWSVALWVCTLQFVAPALSENDMRVGRAVRTAVALVLHNPIFSVGTLVVSIVVMVLSAFTGFLFPGPAGVAVLLADAYRLRMYRYTQPETASSTVARPNWSYLVKDDRERVGPRSLRGMLFPWRD